ARCSRVRLFSSLVGSVRKPLLPSGKAFSWHAMRRARIGRSRGRPVFESSSRSSGGTTPESSMICIASLNWIAVGVRTGPPKPGGTRRLLGREGGRDELDITPPLAHCRNLLRREVLEGPEQSVKIC